MSSERKCILFLQGSPTIFSRVLANELESRGARALRINLAPGDWLLWHDKRATNYKGKLSDWRDYLRDFLVREQVTHIIYYADRLPYHIIAGELAAEMGIEAIAYEFGYLRPDWITFERGGMSTHSRFPNDPGHIRKAAEGLPAPDMRVRFPYKFHHEAVAEVVFHLSNVFLKPFFPNYDRDKYYHPVSEYAHYLPKLFARHRRHVRATRLMRRLIELDTPFFLFPLQLQSDRQIQFNSHFHHLSHPIQDAIRSFSEHAAEDDWLIFKVHPLDNWIEPWNRIVRGLAKRYGVGNRVKVIDGGLLGEMLTQAKGVIVVNSTAGLAAAHAGAPVKVLGMAVFDMPGITCPLSLDQFWKDPTKPDPETIDAFERLLANTIQIKGNVFTDAGQRAAAKGAADKLMTGQVNLPDALVEPPPRLEMARQLGIPTNYEEHMERRGIRNRWFHAPHKPDKPHVEKG